MNLKSFCVFAAGILFNLHIVSAQSAYKPPGRDLIQFSGVVVESDSLKPVPFVSIMIRNTYRGTISDYFGYFSFVAQEGDTVEFSSIGYKKARFVIPDSLSTNRYSLIQVLRTDTVYLRETVVYPWPSREQFKEAFLKMNVPDDDLERAKRNLAHEEMRERMLDMPADGSLNFKFQMQQQQSKLYYAGQLPPNNLLNPIAWAKFIKAWQNGDFKRKN